MRNTPPRTRAFTLIEMLIVMLIIAILSVSLAFSFSNVRDHANFSDTKTEVTNIIQEARGLSLSNVITAGEPTAYYELEFTDSEINLISWSEGMDDEEINSVELPEGYSVSSAYIYYTPPYGDVCIGERPPCDGDTTEVEIILYNEDESLQTQFTISIYGGYPEVEDLEVNDEEEEAEGEAEA